jgi:hypothetical protein
MGGSILSALVIHILTAYKSLLPPPPHNYSFHSIYCNCICPFQSVGYYPSISTVATISSSSFNYNYHPNMKLLSSIVLLSFLSMNEGQLRNVNINSHKQAPVSKGMESPVEVEGRSLRHYTQILDDNNDAAWERELGKKAKVRQH